MNEAALLAARHDHGSVAQGDLERALQRALEAPERQRRLSLRDRSVGRLVAYVVIGGMAAAMWGADLPRTTDADIVPAAERANLERLAAALAELGARLRVVGEPFGVPAPLDAAQLAGLEVVTLLTDHGPLDVTFRPDGTAGYADLARRATTRAVGAHRAVPVADLADIIASKEAAGRPKDLRTLPTLRRLLARLRPPP